jgi:hypothetical protein
MVRFVMRVLVPSRLRRAARARLDARYASKGDHRDALFELQMLRREVVALRREVDRLRAAPARSAAKTPQPRQSTQASQSTRGDEAYRLAIETAESLDQVLQNEVHLWQAVDALRSTLRNGQFTDVSG